MANIPDDMLREGRPSLPFKDIEELLYRRIRPADLDGDEIAIDAVELPDMSVNRGSLGPAKWLLLDETFHSWGVIAFRVKDIPPDQTIWQHGTIPFALEPHHVPLKENYPHSEIWVFRDDVHITREKLELLDPDFHLRWRERLTQVSHVKIPPIETNSRDG